MAALDMECFCSSNLSLFEERNECTTRDIYFLRLLIIQGLWREV